MTKQRYTAEFKAEAIKQVVDRKYSVKEVSERLGVSTHSLYGWMAKAGVSRDNDKADATEEMRRENLRLKAELRRVEEERDILKKAAAYFAKTSG